MKTLDRETIKKTLHAQINVNGHIIGAALGSGMTAKYVAMGGVDFIMALSAGKYRITGRSSYASYLCYGNSNDIVMELGTRELLPIIKNIPILFGILASDPEINLYEYIKKIKMGGFAGIVNFPTLALIDGKFREALEEEGTSFEKEIPQIYPINIISLKTASVKLAYILFAGKKKLPTIDGKTINIPIPKANENIVVNTASLSLSFSSSSPA